MTFARYCALLWVLFGLVTYASTQTQVDGHLNRFHGSWQGDGNAFGRPARLEIKWEWVLGDKFLRLSLRNDMRDNNGRGQVFEGHAYYRPKKTDSSSSANPGSASIARFEAAWFDSRGVSFPIQAHIEGDMLIALWGAPDQEEGKSTYRILEPGKMEVVDFVRQKDGSWREFGKFVVRK
ncbi:MAG: hypothetical protein ACRD8U_11460 [Pyrinomonadaceae bacterium]